MYLTNDLVDYLVYNTPINDVRLRLWERKFPGIGDELGKIFGTQMPTPKQIAEWKETWRETTPYQMEIDITPADRHLVHVTPGLKEDIYQQANRIGIHPYFWDFWKHRVDVYDPFVSSVAAVDTVITPVVSFYNGEHFALFKLAWQ